MDEVVSVDSEKVSHLLISFTLTVELFADKLSAIGMKVAVGAWILTDSESHGFVLILQRCLGEGAEKNENVKTGFPQLNIKLTFDSSKVSTFH